MVNMKTIVITVVLSTDDDTYNQIEETKWQEEKPMQFLR